MSKNFRKIITLITFYTSLSVSFATDNCTFYFQSKPLSILSTLDSEIQKMNSIEDLNAIIKQLSQLQIISESRIENIKKQDISTYANALNLQLKFYDPYSLEYVFKMIFHKNDLNSLLYFYYKNLNDSQKTIFSNFIKTWSKSENELERAAYDTILNSFIFDTSLGIDVKYQQKLLPFIFDINALNRAGATALTAAALHKEVSSIVFLLEQGANPNQRNQYGYLPLQFAYLNGDRETIQILTERGAEVDINNNSKLLEEPILTIAIKNSFGGIKALRLILTLSPDINYQSPTDHNRTALMTAIFLHKYDEVLELMKHSPNLNLKDKNGFTVFDYAKNAPPEYLKLLSDFK